MRHTAWTNKERPPAVLSFEQDEVESHELSTANGEVRLDAVFLAGTAPLWYPDATFPPGSYTRTLWQREDGAVLTWDQRLVKAFTFSAPLNAGTGRSELHVRITFRPGGSASWVPEAELAQVLAEELAQASSEEE